MSTDKRNTNKNQNRNAPARTNAPKGQFVDRNQFHNVDIPMPETANRRRKPAEKTNKSKKTGSVLSLFSTKPKKKAPPPQRKRRPAQPPQQRQRRPLQLPEEGIEHVTVRNPSDIIDFFGDMNYLQQEIENPFVKDDDEAADYKPQIQEEQEPQPKPQPKPAPAPQLPEDNEADEEAAKKQRMFAAIEALKAVEKVKVEHTPQPEPEPEPEPEPQNVEFTDYTEQEQSEEPQPQEDNNVFPDIQQIAYEDDGYVAQDYDDEDEEEVDDDDKPSFVYKSIPVKKPESEPEPEQQEPEIKIKATQNPRRKPPVSQTDSKKIKVTDLREARKKQKSKKHKKTVILIVILIAMGISLFVTRGYWLPKLNGIFDNTHATIFNDGKTEKGNYPIKLSESAESQIGNCNGYMVRLDDNHIVFYNENGKEDKSFSHNYGEPKIDMAGKRVLAYDYNGNDFEVLNRKKSIYSKETSNAILLAKIAENGNVAVVTQTEKYVAFLTIYDENGSEIYTWASNRRITAVDFAADGDSCYISTIGSDAGSIKSMIYYVSFDTAQAVMESSEIDTIALGVCKTDNGQYWVVGDTEFYMLDGNGQELYKYQYDGKLVSFDIGEGRVGILTDTVNNKAGRLIIFDEESFADGGELKPTTVLDTTGGPKVVRIFDAVALVLSNTVVESYDMGGNLLATANVSTDYVDFTFFEKSIYFLGYHEINKIAFNT